VSRLLHEIMDIVYETLNEIDPLDCHDGYDYAYETALLMADVHLAMRGKEFTTKDEETVTKGVRWAFDLINEEYNGPMPEEVVLDIAGVLNKQLREYHKTLGETDDDCERVQEPKKVIDPKLLN
jgi:hypothetical protein